MFLNTPDHKKIHIPPALIWAQCVIFAALYAIWVIYELLYFRRVLLISGAVLALYPIYQYRSYLFQKRAIPLWLMVGLFAWALFHLLFLSHDYAAQLLELRRIWKYAGLGAVFAFGLGLSLANANAKQRASYWPVIYLGLCLPMLIYLIKYALTMHAPLDISVPAFLKINFDNNSAYYVPKTDYVAFCLPVLALSLGQIFSLLTSHLKLYSRQYLSMCLYLFAIGATLFLFYVQNTKNGIVYAILCIALFLALVLFKVSSVKLWHKAFFVIVVVLTIVTMLIPHLQKNESWRSLIADTRVGFQLEQYPQWKYGDGQIFPTNEYGKTVSITNYMRAAWFKAGLQLAAKDPLGYGLVEDSFKRMAKTKWPEVSPSLSHSHSGWLDLMLGVGIPGVFCIFCALLINIKQRHGAAQPWGSMVFWTLIANLMLWATTEVAATVTFAVLIFWVSWACGLTLVDQSSKRDAETGLQ
jgi:hypothetical protein